MYDEQWHTMDNNKRKSSSLKNCYTLYFIDILSIYIYILFYLHKEKYYTYFIVKHDYETTVYFCL